MRALLLFLLTVPVFGQVVVSDAINQNRLFGRWLTTGLQAPSSVNPTLLCSQQINRPLVGSSAVNNTGIKYRNRNALYFTGASMSYTNTDSSFPTGDFTVAVWFATTKTYSSGTYGWILTYGSLSGGQLVGVGIGTDATMGTSAFGVTQYGNSVGSGSYVVNDGNWHSGVITRVGTSYNVFVDGVLRNTKTMTTSTVLNKASIGSLTDLTSKYTDYLADLRLYGRAWSINEVVAFHRGLQ